MLSQHFFKEWGLEFGAGIWIQNLTHAKQVLYHWAVTHIWRCLQNVNKLYSIPRGDRYMSPLPSLLCMWCVYAHTHAYSCVLKVDIKRFSSPTLFFILLDSISLNLKPTVIPDELVSTLPELGSRYTQPYLASADPGIRPYACPARLNTEPLPPPAPGPFFF